MNSDIIMTLLSGPDAKQLIGKHMKDLRLQEGLTQEGLARRSGVPLATLRKFEREGALSLSSFIKLLMVFGRLEAVVDALKPEEVTFKSIDDMLTGKPQKQRKYGWRT